LNTIGKIKIGTTHKEQYYQKYPVLKYKVNNLKKVGRISYTYDGGGSSSGDFLDNCPFVSFVSQKIHLRKPCPLIFNNLRT
jgi:hypothetical protein